MTWQNGRLAVKRSTRMSAHVVLFAIVISIAALAATPAGAGLGVRPGENNFDTWVLLQNPGDARANATVTFNSEDGQATQRDFVVEAHSRRTVFANEYVSGQAFSTTVESDEKIIAERSEYFSYKGAIDGGHSKAGLNALSRKWYFAEGYTGPGFSEYLLVLNPTQLAAALDFTFMREDGSSVTKSFDLAPASRFTLDVASVEGVAGSPASVLVESSRPVMAERTMYFTYDGKIAGGDAVPGARAPRNDWFFAEGYVGPGFETWVLIMNPNDAPIEAGVYFDSGEGG